MLTAKLNASLDALIDEAKHKVAFTKKGKCRPGGANPALPKIGKHVQCRHGWLCDRQGTCPFRHGCVLSRRPKGTQPSHRTLRLGVTSKTRVVVLDGLNVCHTACDASRCGPLTARSLLPVVDKYRSSGVKVLVFFPRRVSHTNEIMHVSELKMRLENNDVCFTPSGSTDDLFMIQYAKMVPCCKIVTNDRFADHVEKGVTTHEWVRDHVAPYMYVGDMFVPSE